MIHHIILILFGAFAQACLSWFLDFCLQPENIFYPYFLWLERNVKGFWYKPLGGCVVCSNVWQSILSFLPYCLLIGAFPDTLFHAIGWLLIYIVISNAFLRLLLKFK